MSMKDKYSYIELNWVNKANSPVASMVIYYGDSKLHWVWLLPFSLVFTLFEFLIVHPLIKIEKLFRKIR